MRLSGSLLFSMLFIDTIIIFLFIIIFLLCILQDQVDIIGYVVGIVSSLFYIGSRLSQIVKNVSFKRVK